MTEKQEIYVIYSLGDNGWEFDTPLHRTLDSAKERAEKWFKGNTIKWEDNGDTIDIVINGEEGLVCIGRLDLVD